MEARVFMTDVPFHEFVHTSRMSTFVAVLMGTALWFETLRPASSNVLPMRARADVAPTLQNNAR